MLVRHSRLLIRQDKPDVGYQPVGDYSPVLKLSLRNIPDASLIERASKCRTL